MPFPDEDDISLGASLKRRRLALEFTQGDTAQHFGILKDSYQKWEWNENVPEISLRKEVVIFLGFNHWNDGSGSLANKVLLYRIEHGLTRMELGKLIGVSDSSIERIEKRRCSVSKKMKVRIIEYIENQFN